MQALLWPLELGLGTQPTLCAWPLEMRLGTHNPRLVAWPLESLGATQQSLDCEPLTPNSRGHATKR